MEFKLTRAMENLITLTTAKCKAKWTIIGARVIFSWIWDTTVLFYSVNIILDSLDAIFNKF